VFRDCQMHLFKYLFEKKGDAFDFLSSFWWTSCQKSTVIGLLLRHKQSLRERLQRTTTRLCMGDWSHVRFNGDFKYQSKMKVNPFFTAPMSNYFLWELWFADLFIHVESELTLHAVECSIAYLALEGSNLRLVINKEVIHKNSTFFKLTVTLDCWMKWLEIQCFSVRVSMK